MSDTTCRNCGKTRKRSHLGGECYYGGWVCCERCDLQASLELEQTMPGHGITQKKVNESVARDIRTLWKYGEAHP